MCCPPPSLQITPVWRTSERSASAASPPEADRLRRSIAAQGADGKDDGAHAHSTDDALVRCYAIPSPPPLRESSIRIFGGSNSPEAAGSHRWLPNGSAGRHEGGIDTR